MNEEEAKTLRYILVLTDTESDSLEELATKYALSLTKNDDGTVQFYFPEMIHRILDCSIDDLHDELEKEPTIETVFIVYEYK